ncbi:MAG: DUF3341 domain-containing protein [Oligoflexia bacterium]|nr:DUF3341 domain-containing protein [Oligoflexia bacterium]
MKEEFGNKNKKGKSSVFGIFHDRLALESAVDALKGHGFRNSDISVLMQSEDEAQDFAHEKNTKAPEGIATGATAGLFAGGALGWLVGAGLLLIPGLGPFIAAGPIMATIAGAGIGGAVGGVTGGLIGLGIPEYEAKRYETFVRHGGKLISIHVDNSEWEEKAKNLLKANGAKDISATSETSVDDKDVDQNPIRKNSSTLSHHSTSADV